MNFDDNLVSTYLIVTDRQTDRHFQTV